MWRSITSPARTLTRKSQQLVHDAPEQLGGLDILVNVAGKQTAVEDIADLTTEQFGATFRTNVFAMFWLCKAALPLMPKGATIINTTSIQSTNPSPMLLDYAPTKAAITAFNHALAKQVVGRGIRVNAVAPGPVLDAAAIFGRPAGQEHPGIWQ